MPIAIAVSSMWSISAGRSVVPQCDETQSQQNVPFLRTQLFGLPPKFGITGCAAAITSAPPGGTGR